jgi:hypothetical protein
MVSNIVMGLRAYIRGLWSGFDHLSYFSGAGCDKVASSFLCAYVRGRLRGSECGSFRVFGCVNLVRIGETNVG